MVNALQRRADVVTQMSLAEGFGLTVAEAMWKARPVVATRVGGIRDQIEDGRTGFLVEPHDLPAFGARVSALLTTPMRPSGSARRRRPASVTRSSGRGTSASTSTCSIASSPRPAARPDRSPLMTSALLDTGAGAARVRAARDFLLAHREDYDTAYHEFRWPASTTSTGRSTGSTGSPPRAANGSRCGSSRRTAANAERSFAELSARSNQVANWLREQGVGRGDRMIVMLGNQVELWELTLAAMKLGAVIIPATPLLGSKRPRRPRRARRRPPRGRERARRLEVRRRTRRLPRASRSVSRLPGGCTTATPTTRRPTSRPTARPRPRTRCCCTSPPARPTSPSWSSTAMPPIRSGTCRPCTGPGSSPATSTSTSPRRDGASTRGATCTHPGSPRRR